MDNRIKYIVYYIDDLCKHHVTFVSSMTEVKFIKERFGNITVERI